MQICNLVVSVNGDIEVFQNVQEQILILNCQETLPWKRPGAQFADQVSLKFQFVPFTEDIIHVSTTCDRDFQKHALYHIYWLACYDVEDYRSRCRESIVHWFATLRNASVSDWLIVYDVGSGGVQSKHRAVILERLRADFTKHLDKIVEFDSHAGRWMTVIQPIRKHLLAVLDDVLPAYHRFLQGEREKYNQPDWNFCSYADLLINYAGIYSGLDLFDQVLMLFDELCALLTILNINAFNSDGKPLWLQELLRVPCEHCPAVGIFVRKPGEFLVRLRAQKISLLELREYIFCCQISSLLAVYRKLKNNPKSKQENKLTLEQDYCQQIMFYTYNFTKTLCEEWRNMQPNIADQEFYAALVLVVYEVFDLCHALCDPSTLKDAALFVCTLWWDLCYQSEQLGKICGLMPQGDDAHQVKRLNLLQWLPTEEQVPQVKKVLQALSAPNAFTDYMVTLHESVLAILKHFKWRRRSRLLARRLADFYVHQGQIRLALSHYQKLLLLYEKEGWFLLMNDLLRDVVCHFRQSDGPLFESYARYCLQLSAAQPACFVGASDRQLYLQEFFNVTKQLQDFSIVESNAFKPSILGLQTAALAVAGSYAVALPDRTFDCVVHIVSYLPDSVEASLKICFVETSELSSYCPKYTYISDLTARSVGFASEVSHPLLAARGSDAVIRLVECRDLVYCCLMDVVLQSGANTVTVCGKVLSSESIVLVIDHMHVILAGSVSLTYGVPPADHVFTLEVCQENASISIRPSEVLYKHMPQTVVLTLCNGTTKVDEPTELVLSSEYVQFLDLMQPIIVPPLLPYGRFEHSFVCCCTQSNSSQTNQIIKVTWRGDNEWQKILNFVPLFTTDHCLLTAGHRKFLQIMCTSCGDSFKIVKCSIKLKPEMPVQLLNGERICEVARKENVSFVFALTECSENFTVLLTIDFQNGKTDATNTFTEQFFIENAQTLYEVSAQVEAQVGGVCRLDGPCVLSIFVHALRTDGCPEGKMVIVEVNADASDWHTPDRRVVASFGSDDSAKATMQIYPKSVGYLPLPMIKLQKTLPLPPTGDMSSSGVIPIPASQVYNKTRAKQVHVLQPLKKVAHVPKPKAVDREF